MKKKTTTFYWALILLPAIALGVAMLYMLKLEQDRTGDQLRDATMDRARSVADAVQLVVEGVCGELASTLDGIATEDRVAELSSWMARDPMVRNVFLWQPPQSLLYPDADTPLTDEQKGFIARYRPLFSGERPWRGAPPEDAVPAATTSGYAVQQIADTAGQSTVKPFLNMSRLSREASSKARTDAKNSVKMAKSAPPAAVTEGNWIRWFDDNRLHMLCWRHDLQSDLYWGIELEMIVLISNLIASFPECPEHLSLVLSDDNGDTVHQAGPAVADGRKPDIRLSLSPQLPHWQLTAFLNPVTGKHSSLPFLAGALLVIAMLGAVVSGGILLTAEARRNWRDAQLKTTFVSNVSHELKTPLTTIRMYSEMLQLGRVRDSAKQERYLKTVVDECGRLTRLVNNVLDFSRLEQGRRKYRAQLTDVNAFIGELLAVHHPRIENAGLEVDTQLEDGILLARADRDALEQALLNLIDNTIKYATEGGELALATTRRASEVIVQVKDRGPGIPAAHRTRIFESFHRVDDSLTTEKPGSGLGLSIARGLLKGMGGSLSYSVRPGGGSIFEITVPAADINPDRKESDE